jgi:SAM-dependent methyltransferase
MSSKCNVCGAILGRALYESDGELSLSSLCQVLRAKTSVYQCENCGHIQSAVLGDVSSFYDKSYPILTNSEDEDQIYEVVNGVPIFRTEHQVRTMIDKLPLGQGALLLDFGCAKSSTIKSLMAHRQDVVPHLFDVSDTYIEFWRSFVRPENWATYEPKSNWKGRFDVVTSFFSLEHIVEPAKALDTIASLLKPDGLLYGVVPNAFSNIADMVVVDHVNHFTPSSLSHLFQKSGFAVEFIDTEAHRGALVFLARFVGAMRLKSAPIPQDSDRLATEIARAQEISVFWKSAGARARRFENECDKLEVAVYGAGFYGAFLASALRGPERIMCFIDQNPFLQNGNLMGRPIVAPTDLPKDVEVLYVGLNPAHARKIIDGVPALANRNLRYFFL